jgi:maleylacetate reductase
MSRADEPAMRFVHETLGQRVLFGAGAAAANTRAEAERLGSGRPMLLAGRPELADRVAAELPVAGRFGDIVEHVPVGLAQRARDAAAEQRADLLIAVGGGSAIGLAKAVALTSGLPIIAVPTTYAGSEATDVWGLTDRSGKTTGTARAVLPRSVVYDAELTLSLPVDLSIASGLNALAHCVDALWAPAADPINQALGLEAVRSLASGMPAIKVDARDLAARERMQYGAYLAAVAFASAGSGLHHKICHVLGGRFNLPHAPTHAAVLPHVLAFNAGCAAAAVARLGDALGGEDAVAALARLYSSLSAPSSLRELGLDRSSLNEAADAILPVVPPSNPRGVTRNLLRQLLEAAWAGPSTTIAISKGERQ